MTAIDSTVIEQTLKNAKRIVIKFGSQILVDTQGRLAIDKLAALVRQCSELVQQGKQVILVTSGAIASGRFQLGFSLDQQLTRVQKQACAAAGQSNMMQTYQELFRHYGVGVAQVLLNPSDFSQRWRYLSAKALLEELLNLGVVPILNENDALSESGIFEQPSCVATTSFGDNDKLSALVSAQLEADLLVVLSNVEGIFTANPFDDPTAKRLPFIHELEELTRISTAGKSKSGRGGMSSKLEAAQLAAQCGTHIVIATGLANQAIARLFEFSGQNEVFPATFILAHPDKTQNSMKRWIGLASGYSGILTLNQGAKQALLERGASLLTVGIVGVEGEFASHQVVSLQDETGLEFGRGVVHFSSQALQEMVGKSKSELVQRFGAEVANLEVVHRSKLFLSGEEAI
ncbi:MAG: glutamate 5-kinase [Vampirovibrio sp.]|nr:glutamate 5-kinase [Vampirovibrio sp.]